MNNLLDIPQLESPGPTDQFDGITLGALRRMEYTNLMPKLTGRHAINRPNAISLDYVSKELKFSNLDQKDLLLILADEAEPHITRRSLRQQERENYKKSHRIVSFGQAVLSLILKLHQ